MYKLWPGQICTDAQRTLACANDIKQYLWERSLKTDVPITPTSGCNHQKYVGLAQNSCFLYSVANFVFEWAMLLFIYLFIYLFIFGLFIYLFIFGQINFIIIWHGNVMIVAYSF